MVKKHFSKIEEILHTSATCMMSERIELLDVVQVGLSMNRILSTLELYSLKTCYLYDIRVKGAFLEAT